MYRAEIERNGLRVRCGSGSRFPGGDRQSWRVWAAEIAGGGIAGHAEQHVIGVIGIDHDFLVFAAGDLPAVLAIGDRTGGEVLEVMRLCRQVVKSESFNFTAWGKRVADSSGDRIAAVAYGFSRDIVGVVYREDVVTCAASHAVCACSAVDEVVADEAVQGVGGIAADQHIIEVGAGHVERNRAGVRREIDPCGKQVCQVNIADCVCADGDAAADKLAGYVDGFIDVGNSVASDVAAVVRHAGIEHPYADDLGVGGFLVGADDVIVGDVQGGIAKSQDRAGINELGARITDAGYGVAADGSGGVNGLDAVLGHDGLGAAAGNGDAGYVEIGPVEDRGVLLVVADRATSHGERH